MASSILSSGHGTSSVPLTQPAVSKSHLNMWKDFVNSQPWTSLFPRPREPEWQFKFEKLCDRYRALNNRHSCRWHRELYELCDALRQEAEKKITALSLNGKSIEEKAIASCQLMRDLKSACGSILFIADHFSLDLQDTILATNAGELASREALVVIHQHYTQTT